MSSTVTTPIAAGTWKADPVHSSVAFEIEHLGVSSFRGRFRDFEASVTVEGDTTSIAGAAQVESIDVDDQQLHAHLLSPDFFDAERAPELSFEGVSASHDGGALVVPGELTIRGKTQQIEARGSVGEPVTDLHGNDRIGLRLEATVDRRDFGLGPNMDLPNGKPVIADRVTLLAELELVKEV